MEIQVEWGLAILLIVIAAAHIAEENLAGFRRFLNTQWFDGNDNCPVTRFKSVVFDQLGLFVGLAALAIAGTVANAFWFFVALGFVAADVMQHAAFSVSKRGYTPGIATSAGYLAYIGYVLSRIEGQGTLDQPLAWIALASGAALIAINYGLARRKVRLGRCQLAAA